MARYLLNVAWVASGAGYMKKRVWGLMALSAAAVLLGTATVTRADTLPPFGVYGVASACCETPGNYGNAYLTKTSPTLGGFAHLDEGNGSATASISGISGSPVLSATSSGQAVADMDLTYYMELSSSVGQVYGINISGPGTLTVTQSNSSSFTTVKGFVEVCNSDCSSTSSPIANIFSTLPDFTNAGTYNYNLGFSMDSGVIYQVTLEATAFGTATTTLDPLFSINDPNAQDFSLNFSAGIPNGAVSATPLPAALPLFASGLGALGVLGWRRKRKVAAAIAA
jgi:hypothetical protein